MKLSYSILTTSFIQKLFVVPTEKNIIYITIYYCVTKKINRKKNDNEFDNHKIIFGNMDFKDTYHMSSSED